MCNSQGQSSNKSQVAFSPFQIWFFNNSWNVFAVLPWPWTPQYISRSLAPLPCIHVCQSNERATSISNCSVVTVCQVCYRVSPLHLIWILQTLQWLGFKQQMCLLAICYTVCQEVGGGGVASRSDRLQTAWLQLCGKARLHIDRWPPKCGAMIFMTESH